jgi:anti-sigma B factor antagonist
MVPLARVSERTLGEAQLVEVTGELDVANAEEFTEMVFGAVARQDARVVIDLSEADFIDSTVLNVLFASGRKMRKSGGKLAIVCTKDHILRVLEAAGVESAHPVVGTRDEALARLA